MFQSSLHLNWAIHTRHSHPTLISIHHLEGNLYTVAPLRDQGHSLSPIVLNIATLNRLYMLHETSQNIGRLSQGKLLSWTDSGSAVETMQVTHISGQKHQD